LQILQALQAQGKPLPRYTIVDISSSLRARQQATLAAFADQVRWVDALPDDMQGVVLGNEVLDATRRVTPLLQTKFDERNGTVSPDGRWLAYESNSSGPVEIYVRPFPNVGGGQWLVSTAGGRTPLWARSGKELFYVGADEAVLRVPVEARGGTWNAGTPMKLLDARYLTHVGADVRMYDVSPDGQRFLMLKALGTDPESGPSALIVVQHWDEELRRLVPTGRR